MRKFALLALIAIVPVGLFAAELRLKDGSVHYGQLISATGDSIVFQDQSGVNRRFETNRIRSIDFEAISSASDRFGSTRSNTAYRSADDLGVLDAGTTVSVRTDQEIHSDTAAEGRTYPATISEDVIGAGGRVIIPRGSEAELVIRRVEEGGRVSGGNLTLDLQSVRVGGSRYSVSTEDVEQKNRSGIGANRRTAEMVGGGAALGTLLGAIAGGGKGAAIGAIAGAAAGGGVQVLTRGREINVPAETVLNFRLDQPLRLQLVR